MRTKIIDGFDSRYRITDTGLVQSCLLKGSSRKIEQWRNLIQCEHFGYMVTHLTFKKKIHYLRAHRLVAEYFIPNPENKKWVNHKDGNKANNHHSNLEWVTPKENSQHAVKLGLMQNQKGEANNSSKLTEIQVRAIRDLIKMSWANYKIAEVFNVSATIISYIRNRKTWDHLE